MATEFIGRLNASDDRRALPAIALTTDTSAITAIANDFGADAIYERQVKST